MKQIYLSHRYKHTSPHVENRTIGAPSEVHCRGAREERGRLRGKKWQIRGGKGSSKSRRLKTVGRIEEDRDDEKVRKCKSQAAEQRVKRGERT